MTIFLLAVGAPVVRQSVFGDWLVDDGSLVPQHAADRRTAYAEAAARQIVPPVDAVRPCRGGQGVVNGRDPVRPLAVERAVTEDSAPAVASSGPAVHLPQGCGGTASGSSLNPPEHDGPDAAKACYRRKGVGVPAAVGAVIPAGGRST